MRSFLGKLYRH